MSTRAHDSTSKLSLATQGYTTLNSTIGHTRFNSADNIPQTELKPVLIEWQIPRSELLHHFILNGFETSDSMPLCQS